MNFLTWFGIGIATIVIPLFIEALRNSPKERRIRRAFHELYMIFYKKGDFVSNTIFGLAALLGPLLTVIFVYFIISDWLDRSAMNKDDKKIYPWPWDNS